MTAAPEHPLSGAFARLQRATEHLAELDGLIRPLMDEQLRATIGTIRFMTTPYPGLQHTRLDADLPLSAGILIGDAVQDMRSALDYLVYELARHHSGQIVPGTQFPIESTRAAFARRHRHPTGNPRGDRGIFLRGVCPVHVSLIQELQPAYGREWPARLAALSNEDKHRNIVASISAVQSDLGFGEREIDPPIIKLERGQITVALPGSEGGQSQMNLYLSIHIATRDNVRITQDLYRIHDRVQETLMRFQGEFARQPVADCPFGYVAHAKS